MKMRLCLAVVLAMALVVGGFSASALARCVQTVKVIKVTNYDADIAESKHSVYGQPMYDVLPGYVWVWTIETDDPELLNAAQAAYVSGAPAEITGDAESCPTEGAVRDGGIAKLIYLTGK